MKIVRPATADDEARGARLRVVIAPGIGIGPGKAELMDGIRETGSIAAAGRRIGMSYKRAWLLVSALNGHFPTPLIEASKGGRDGGGARLTALGEEVLGAYREMQARTDKAIQPVLARLDKLRVGDGKLARPRRKTAPAKSRVGTRGARTSAKLKPVSKAKPR